MEKKILTVAMSDPLMFTLVQDLEFRTGYRVRQAVATRDEIIEAIHLSGYPDKALIRATQSGVGLKGRGAGSAGG